jgi:serine/threonine protein phosphatase PrpC
MFAGKFSGTTATLVIVDGLTVTAACVGDSRCVLDAQGTVIALTIDHRLETNEEECVPFSYMRVSSSTNNFQCGLQKLWWCAKSLSVCCTGGSA